MIDVDLLVLDVVDSTNDEVLRRAAAGTREGCAVLGYRQRAGHGRSGRSWQSPAGGLYLSFLLEPEVAPERLASVSLVAALSVLRVLRGVLPESCAAGVQLKWPNDVVYVSESVDADKSDAPLRKLCGINLVARGSGVCIGVGVNVFTPDEPQTLTDAAAPASKYLPVYLDELGYMGSGAQLSSRPEEIRGLAQDILAEFAVRYELWRRDGFAPFMEEYNHALMLVGSPVVIENLSGGVLAAGTVLGVDISGALLVKAPDGRVQAVQSGEAHLR